MLCFQSFLGLGVSGICIQWTILLVTFLNRAIQGCVIAIKIFKILGWTLLWFHDMWISILARPPQTRKAPNTKFERNRTICSGVKMPLPSGTDNAPSCQF